MQVNSDPTNQDPEVKYLVADVCEAYQEGLDIYNNRIQFLVIGDDVVAADELRGSFDTGYKDIGQAYATYYKQAGAHFARGDLNTQKKLTRQLHILATQVVEALQNASDDALSGIPSLPGSFHQHTIINYDLFYRISESVRMSCLTSLDVLFTNIQDWAVPLHTLPPLASPSTSSTASSAEPEPQNFFDRTKSPFHRHRYVYQQLPTPLSFRLVKVEKTRPWVICEMQTFQLRDPPPFQALSYCWGKYGRRSDIWVNNQLLQISPNLKRGLERLHKFFHKWTSEEWIWIDQICINQEDLAERTQQVRLMRAVYQQATTTVIWLGPDDGNAGLAFQLAHDIYRFSLHVKVADQKEKDRGNPPPEIILAPPPNQLPSEEDKKWEALPRFLEMAWFERCWIIQEVVVSRGDAILLCGPHQLLWSRFRKAMMWLSEYNAKYRMDRLRLVKSISDLSSTRDVWELQALLHSTRPFQATDPRDKVFALLGLAGETEMPEVWPTALTPNYTRTTRDVYVEVTRYCIQKTKNLSILSQVDRCTSLGNPPSIGEFPSWVPRWDLPQKTSSNLSAFLVTQNAAGWRTLTEKFNEACRGLPASLETFTPVDVLRLEGVRVDTVEFCLPGIHPDQHNPAKSTALTHDKVSEEIPKLYNTCKERLSHLPLETFARSFFHVTTAGLTPEQMDARHEPMTHFRAFLLSTSPKSLEPESHDPIHSLRAALKTNLSVSTLTPSITPPALEDPKRSSFMRKRSSTSVSRSSSTIPVTKHDPDQPDPTRYSSALGPMLNRRLFITSSGHLGLGPAIMLSGDIVTVLFGGKVPFVLRHITGDQWRLVGECYVEGYMQGEGLVFRGETSETGMETEWFELV